MSSDENRHRLVEFPILVHSVRDNGHDYGQHFLIHNTGIEPVTHLATAETATIRLLRFHYKRVSSVRDVGRASLYFVMFNSGRTATILNLLVASAVRRW